MNDYYSSINENPTEYNQPSPNRPRAATTMEIASVILGVLSILSVSFIIPTLPLAGLGIIMALLSRTNDGGFNTKVGKTGLILSIGGIVTLIVTISLLVYTILSTPDFANLYKQMYQDVYDYYYNGGDYPDIEQYLPEYSDYDTL